MVCLRLCRTSICRAALRRDRYSDNSYQQSSALIAGMASPVFGRTLFVRLTAWCVGAPKAVAPIATTLYRSDPSSVREPPVSRPSATRKISSRAAVAQIQSFSTRVDHTCDAAAHRYAAPVLLPLPNVKPPPLCDKLFPGPIRRGLPNLVANYGGLVER